ncbi:LITAF domain-containing protein-like [Cololabis saira]|uniref:LITAF domain-containing protein-like n=1 Tax=Cololabis saira TaxID=129043 RepID=UPI002AD1F2B2|nr:LITAF domain-containing protein-like [Cololabis saira]XP_061567490.1 LITAF domain-containing protein-like [Cololabis saira]
MEKGSPPQESAPPYPGPPLSYGSTPPQPGFVPAGYQGDIAPPQTAPVTTVRHVIVTPELYDAPGQARCPHCQQAVVTDIDRVPNLSAWLICGCFTLFGCWLCCCIPFCVDSCKNVKHYCPKCKHLIHIHKN